MLSIIPFQEEQRLTGNPSRTKIWRKVRAGTWSLIDAAAQSDPPRPETIALLRRLMG